MNHPVTDARLVELYSQYRACLRDSVTLAIAPYESPFAGATFPIQAWFFREGASNYLREIPNGINDFRRSIRQLDAWRMVCSDVAENERLSLVLEHVRPLASHCLGAPYAIKGRLIFATCTIASVAQQFSSSGKARLKWSGKHADWEAAQRLAGHLASWPALGSAITAINASSFHEQTKRYRNSYQHGQPRGIELGYVTEILRAEGQVEQWTLGQAEPLRIADLIPALVEEHDRAMAALHAFIDFTRELHLSESNT